MRASRLVTLLFVLQRRRAATASELAAELEVSERTIYRDVAALTEAGVPLWTEPGPSGGIRLVEGWRSRLDGLTAPEAAAILGVAAPQVLADLGLSSALAGAQAKLLATLPEPLRAHAAMVAERVHLDAPGWFHTPREVTALSTVAEAVWSQQVLHVRYRRGVGENATEVERTVEPLGLVLKAGVWYLVAAVADGGEVPVRTYRLDRIAGATPSGATFSRPADFDLAAHWAQGARRFEGSLLRASVRLRLSPRGLRRLPLVTDTEAAQRAVDAAQEQDDGWSLVTLETEGDEIIAGQLLSLGPEVEVLEPAAVRYRLAATARRVAELNADS
ncbi:putative DNA-binding transcriptional regulator YafY [Pseudonocardia sediminis]|uniref:Putative DNA-binding transcriptional regulator YafY n=1 Tax=Pseudonocardia sediminis TaxID=1397368 RepID=A0A4Q7V0Q7_PSEST|nr:YafY family protein [Pseudonocardia sediminis]RZT88042.1 putative DNA-binding transcriptional regulator YafY [Pseudonocardia sediminis]